MLGGAYLCYEGVEKIFEIIVPHRAHEHEAQLVSVALKPQTLEDEKVASAIKTDFILSAEIMAITLAALPNGGLLTQALVLALVGFGITLAVYGAVAVIVKADDAGVALAKNNRPNAVGGLSRVFGKAIVRGMPWFLMVLSAVGTAAMIWVGGGIIVHGLETHGFSEVDHVIAGLATAVSGAVPWAAKTVEWIVIASLSGLFGLLIGAILIPVVGFVAAPAWRVTKDYLNRSPKSA
jgi:predicted DNA repair protein MutK